MSKLRFLIALWGAKCARIGLKILRRNATYFPGKLALKICPDFMRQAGKPKRIVAVTGTNGKTTVCNMLADILERSGYRTLSNRAGSNINAGIAATLVRGCTFFGKARHDIAVFEVDERSSRRVYPYLTPDYLAVTNLFRDSFMRNAHPEYIAGIISDYIPARTKMILNADDLMSAGIAPGNDRVYYGIGPLASDVTECVNLINDMQICPKCGGKLIYDYRRYHHIGRARCSDCGFASPDCNYYGSNVDLEKLTMTIRDKEGSFTYRLMSDSVFNIYNTVTVVAVLRELGLAPETIAQGLKDCGIVETRYNVKEAGGIHVVMQMSKDKNALANSRVFDYVSSLPGSKQIIMMQNCKEDAQHGSENISWMFDCDFEFLNKDNIKRIVCTGPRSKDYVFRLLMAGVPEERIRCTENEINAPNLLDYDGESDVYIFYGTDAIPLTRSVRDKVATKAMEAVCE
jgi:ssDNA-binding Zn-finger/Zn-ribbon topoisomerase 1